ncbi:hypothetical protein FY528_15315 [Hymenobacter lutimineralis]|uniref:Uncharacterized protein n=1 Tax=Hymenobacter lutimineralis TaxID=2606448 RepID=A0A5D6UUM2_9BACT|nr:MULTISPECIES: hypothetical protein [Hymenobacter]QIX60549.1 hypothetical protein HER32_04845 [Hymenobacter sp. BT18]TYZ07431.1 hypothetical protein FY528_15315 [Hymenobacter lutimineralis]
MDLHTFKQLHQTEQGIRLAQAGHHLADRAEHGCRLQLFAFGDFYAEVWRLVGEERVLFINPFQNPAQLQPWLEAVQLPGEWA